MSIATRFMPPSKSATDPNWQTARSSSAAAPAESCSPAVTWQGFMACARRCRCSGHWRLARMRSSSGRIWRSTVLSDVRCAPRCGSSPHWSNRLSIDEAFLHLGGTEALHEACPAQLLAGLAKRIETAHGITVSIGLSDNKFLAKIASDLDKPRGFAVLSRSEARGVPRRQTGLAAVGRRNGDAAAARRRRHHPDRPAG